MPVTSANKFILQRVDSQFFDKIYCYHQSHVLRLTLLFSDKVQIRLRRKVLCLGILEWCKAVPYMPDDFEESTTFRFCILTIHSLRQSKIYIDITIQ